MKIYIPRDLNYIGNELQKRGYKIVNDGEDTKYDAIICKLKDNGLANLHIKNKNTLIIDLGKRNIEEIEYILKDRSF
ncbi:YkuS family protein [Clostridium luticellarii]|jgi:hypothetical protein|uniref:YkuS family protein n=1 Tax=Clostridium luticellarii TaxID=1691940 RepID=A0A2T0B1R2_9CLOT|nr:YkuS family protein [Clostridium luticellarii]MCI1945858.1 YkuS family protein [Clostridium luticellarii]MCI1969190.1 YkuS family protein [Clostridium luticellarii]MCI2040501.1 YkuS family protein [Clostridium luticellarii]PRR77731.1 hypothetical protein CLLU_36940 [Clostridium luticellarii]